MTSSTDQQREFAEDFTVLLVEDEPVTAKTTTKALETKKIKVVHVETGEKALEVLEDQTQDLDLVLLDLGLPGASGLQVLESIRKSRTAMELPVVIVTAAQGNEVVLEALHTGANDYLTKPVNREIMHARVVTQARLRRLHQGTLLKREYETLAAMIATYHHELNNPLGIALGYLRMLKSKTGSSAEIEALERNLERIAGVVKQIGLASERPIQKQEYSSTDTKMLKLNDD